MDHANAVGPTSTEGSFYQSSVQLSWTKYTTQRPVDDKMLQLLGKEEEEEVC